MECVGDLQGLGHVETRGHRQIRRERKARELATIARLIHAEVMALLRSLDGYTVGHVPRALNKDADRLSNVAIDGH